MMFYTNDRIVKKSGQEIVQHMPFSLCLNRRDDCRC